MKYPDFGFRPKEVIDRLNDRVVIANQCWNCVVFHPANIIPAMISLVVYDEVEFVEENGPERIVEVDREAVAVA